MAILKGRTEESMKKGCSKTETLGMKMLSYIPEGDGTEGLQQPSPLRRTCIVAYGKDNYIGSVI